MCLYFTCELKFPVHNECCGTLFYVLTQSVRALSVHLGQVMGMSRLGVKLTDLPRFNDNRSMLANGESDAG